MTRSCTVALAMRLHKVSLEDFPRLALKKKIRDTKAGEMIGFKDRLKSQEQLYDEIDPLAINTDLL